METMIDMYRDNVAEAERALHRYQIYGDCGRRSSAELAKRESILADAKDSLFCYLNDC